MERTIAASPERVFDWLADPANLTTSPLFLKAGWAKDSSGPGVGAVREMTGLGLWLHEQITAYDAPRSCSYVVVGSFPASQHEGGTVTCTPSGNGTHVEWVSGYTLPARAGGKVIEVVTLPLLRSLVFRAVLAGCAKALGWHRIRERHFEPGPTTARIHGVRYGPDAVQRNNIARRRRQA